MFGLANLGQSSPLIGLFSGGANNPSAQTASQIPSLTGLLPSAAQSAANGNNQLSQLAMLLGGFGI